MNNFRLYLSMLFVLLAFTMSSCELVGDIFKAGMWTALIIIVIVVALIIWIFKKITRR
ncbi:hypothetical protein [Pontibacter harenae]|uniref:hypothetical protein n=1 Tax=Pontibacter harenae TaxID=2894083 RepID=UPI001E4831D9|nr:hypothetical protein [Pontibacter harenae]MCC9166439.1 hypothetical protein [Pontibacter harenae]